MKIFNRKNPSDSTDFPAGIQTAARCDTDKFDIPPCDCYDPLLFNRLRLAVPVIDAAIMKIIRLTGGYKVISPVTSLQNDLDRFLSEVPVGLSGNSIYSFSDCFLDNLLTYGSAVGEIVFSKDCLGISNLFLANPDDIIIRFGRSPDERLFFVRAQNDSLIPISHPERICFSSLGSVSGKGRSVLAGLPALSGILLRIYQCIGQNFDRAGNVRYAVTYKPSSDSGERAFAKDRAVQIAKEWADGMNSAKYGQVKDFIAVGDVDIKVIGAENQLFDTSVPVRELLEQLISKLSIPPFLLGLNWSSTERMSAQQADILTSELEYYRRILSPVICKVADAFLRLCGCTLSSHIEWDNINLQDETQLADARLKNAQAAEIELRISSSSQN